MDFLEASELLLKNGIRKDATRGEILKTIKRNEAFKKENEDTLLIVAELAQALQECVDTADRVIDYCKWELKQRPKFAVGDVCRVVEGSTKSGADIIGKLVIIDKICHNKAHTERYDSFYYVTEAKRGGIWENELKLVARGKDFYKKS